MPTGHAEAEWPNKPPLGALRVPWPRLALLARLLLPTGSLLLGGVPTFLVAVAIQEGGYRLAARASTVPVLASRLFLAAYVLRATVALGAQTVAMLRGGSGALFQDDYTYDLVADWLVRIAAGEGMAIFPGHVHLLDNLYLYLVTALYALFGQAILVPKLLNCGLAALSVVLIAEIAAHAFSAVVGRVAGAVAVVLPSLVLWSVVVLKEMLVLASILVALRALQVIAAERSLRTNRAANAGVALVGGLALLDDVRNPVFLLLLGVTVVLWLGRSATRLVGVHRPLAIAAAALLVVSTLWVARVRAPDTMLGRLTRPDDIARALDHRRALEGLSAQTRLGPPDSTSMRDVVEIPTYREPETLSLVGSLVGPLAFALLAPAPWQVRSLLEAFASAEMVLWYVLLLAGVLGAATRPTSRLFIVALLLYAVGTLGLLGVAEGNLGNLLRHRLMLVPPVLIFGAAGLVQLRSRARARVLQSEPRPLRVPV